MNKAKLILFTRVPEKGKVKTRLAADLGEAKALELHKKLLLRTLHAIRTAGISYSTYVPELPPAFPDEFRNAQLQSGADLGGRMLAAIQNENLRDPGPTLIVGSDCPGLNAGHLQKAQSLLDDHDLVLGPAKDGGYYLIGMNIPREALFSGISWSSSSVLHQTLEIARSQNLKVALLPILQDIDMLSDLLEWESKNGLL